MTTICFALRKKEIFVVDAVFDDMLAAMRRAGAVELTATEVDRLTAQAITQVGEGEHRHDVAAKEFIGQDAAVLAKAAGRNIPADTEIIFAEVPESNPFVAVEQMMPFLPFVRVRDIDEAIAKAKHYEHGFRHTEHHSHQRCSQHDKNGPSLRYHTVCKKMAHASLHWG